MRTLVDRLADALVEMQNKPSMLPDRYVNGMWDGYRVQARWLLDQIGIDGNHQAEIEALEANPPFLVDEPGEMTAEDWAEYWRHQSVNPDGDAARTVRR
jgi:hypothetical protein